MIFFKFQMFISNVFFQKRRVILHFILKITINYLNNCLYSLIEIIIGFGLDFIKSNPKLIILNNNKIFAHK